MQLYVGIDWAQKDHAVCLMAANKRVVSEFVIEHSEEGFLKLRNRILKHASVEEASVGIETHYNSIVEFLMDSGITVKVIHPNTINSDRKSYSSSGAKSDKADARIIARHLINSGDIIRVYRPDSDGTIAIRQLTAERRRLVTEATAACNQLRNHIERFHPGFRGLFSSLHRNVYQALLLKYPNQASLDGITIDDIQAVLAEASYGKGVTAEEIYEKIKAAPQGPRGKKGKSGAAIIRAAVKKLQALDEITSIINDEIKDCMDDHPDQEIFRSLPCAGVATASSLLVTFGDDRERFKNAEELGSLNGLTPVTRASGKYHSAQFRISCRKTGRTAFFLWMSGLLLHDPWTQAVYKRLRKEGKHHPHALRILSRSWSRIVFACWKNRTPFDPSKMEKRMKMIGA